VANWNSTGQRTKPKPLPPPSNILHEINYRDYRIVQTDDRALVGSLYPDKFGFAATSGFVVLDAFDEHVFPAGMHWFFTPEDAVSAIEMLDTILPGIKESQPCTTLLYEYSTMRQYRREFWITYNAIARMQAICDEAKRFDDNPVDEMQKCLSGLRAAVSQGRSIG
jgi:hypothetical protein